MKKIFMSINEFVVVDGKALPKHPDYFGGHYYYDDLPEGKLRVENSTTADQTGKFRDGKNSSRITTRDILLEESEDFW